MFMACMFTTTSLHAQVEIDTTSLEEMLNNVEPATVEAVEDTTYNESVDDENYASTTDEEEETDNGLSLRTISDEDWKKVLSDTSFKYKKEKEIEKKKDIPSKPVFDGIGNFFNSGFFKFLLYLLIAGVLLFIVYSLFSNGNIDFKTMWKRPAKEVSNTSYENITEYTEWEKALMEALKIPDYRLAVRIHYLSGLQDLNEKGFIKYELEKTNWTYVYELSQTDLNDDFVELTKYFDYIWYGEFALNEENYQMLKSKFIQFKKRVVQ